MTLTDMLNDVMDESQLLENVQETFNRLLSVVAKYDNFVHLHLHTTYSFFDGFNFPENSAKRAKELGMTAQAITDHNHLAGVIDFKKACEKEGIKPLLGYEGYHTWNCDTISLPIEDRYKLAIEAAAKDGITVSKPAKPTTADKELLKPYLYDTTSYHILFLARNQTGWKNLVGLQSESATRGTFNGRFHCDTELMRKYHEGIILTTACIQNTVHDLFIEGKDEEAHCMLNEWHDIFGEDFYVEIQPLSIKKQWVTNLKVLDWARKNGVKAIATNDVHYTLKEDYDDHDTLFAISIGKLKAETNRMRYSNDFWIKSYDEMIESFTLQAMDIERNAFPGKDLYDREQYLTDVINALDETNRIAEKCEDIQIGSSKPVYPEYETPMGMSSETYLTYKCYKALYEYKKTDDTVDVKVYERRLQEELDIINPKGFAPYMLIVEDYIRWANDNGVPTGPGRGSAAGSLVLFLLGVTKIIDPIKYSLLFFRFLTADRTAPPDVDTDFDYEGRQSVIRYLENKYGHDKVCHIGTFSTLKVKSALKEVGRTLDYDFPTMNGITKQIDEISDDPNLTFKKLDKLADGDAKDKATYAKFKNLEDQYPELFRLARRFEFVPKAYGVHASGILITPFPIKEGIPTRTLKDGTIVTLNTGVQLEELGYIKFDILGLKTISVIKNTLKSINSELTFDDLYKEVSFNDVSMYEIIREKKTDGLFQIESNLFKGMIEDIKPTEFNDIVVMNALGRPGPLSAGMPDAYAKRKNGLQEARPMLPNTDDITANSLGTLAYQEQLMLISQRVAGFSDNQADSYLRKATAKKQKDKMALCRQWFIYGKRNEEVPEGYDEKDMNQPMYDPEAKHGDPVLGGINNGYNEKELAKFWTDIEGYCDYLFNLSHSACYSYITILTSYLKAYYPAQFMAALLSMEDKDEKVAKYIKAAEELKLKVLPPSINESGKSFTPKGQRILFGLASIKGVGEEKVDEILAVRPFFSVEDLLDRMPKKVVNKTVATAFAKSGALDEFNDNRFTLLNTIYTIRKDKDERYDEASYKKADAMAFEKQLLGAPISAKPEWEKVKAKKKITHRFEVKRVEERADKTGRLMGFLTLETEGVTVKGLAFASSYVKMQGTLNAEGVQFIEATGKKDENGSFLVDSVKAIDSIESEEVKEIENRFFAILG